MTCDLSASCNLVAWLRRCVTVAAPVESPRSPAAVCAHNGRVGTEDLTRLRDRLIGELRAAGCVAVGVCGVDPLLEARTAIERRRDAGLNAAMQFTYRNPARSTDPRRTLPSAQAAVVVAMSYRSGSDPAPEEASASVARYAAGDTYGELRATLGRGAEVLRAAGHRGVVLADDNALVDRAIAQRAGLGWLGKNTNLLVPGVGSWVVLGSILTDAALAPISTVDPKAGGCGTCTRCLTACPTDALVVPGALDASRCLSWLLQTTGTFPRRYRTALADRIYGCDDCQEVCPPNRRSPDDEDLPRQRSPGDWVDLAFLLTAGDEELLEQLGGWYIPKRDPRYLRRNALVVLGNSGRGDDPDVERLLVSYLNHEDVLLVEHAAWAARALGRDELLESPSVAAHPAVRAELTHPHPRLGHPRPDQQQAHAGRPVGVSLVANRASGETGPDDHR